MVLKVIIADDDALIRESLKIFFEMDERFEVVSTAANGKEAYDKCIENDIDVILLDIRMPILNGVEATKKIAADTSARVLLLTTFDEEEYIKEAFKNGASGYLLKNSTPDEIKNAVLSVYDGNVVMEDSIMEQFTFSKPKDKEDKLKDLTKREAEIVILIAEGLTNNEIAKKLFITEGTVKNAVSNILSKLELKHRTQIAIYYIKD